MTFNIKTQTVRLLSMVFIAGLVLCSGYGQGLQQLQPSYIDHFYQEDSPYSRTCFSEVYLDKSGRMWLNVCGSERVINSVGLFRFDGYQFQPVELFEDNGNPIVSPALKGELDGGQLLGLANSNQFFFFDPDSRVIQQLPFADTTFQKIKLSGFDKVGSTVYTLGFSADQEIHLFRVEDGTLVKELSLDYSEGTWGVQNYPLVVDETEYWLTGNSFPLYRVDRKSGQVRKYGLEDLVNTGKIDVPSISIFEDQFMILLKKENGSVYLFLPNFYGNRFLIFDRQADHFVSMRSQFPADWKPRNLFKDASGNICFLFEDKSGQYRAVLEDKTGKRYDYSAVLSKVKDIRRLVANDFRGQVYAVGNSGLYSIGVREEESVRQAMAGKWISAMAPLPDGRLLVNTVKEGMYCYDEKEQRSFPFEGPECGLTPLIFEKGMKQQIIPDENGNLWMIANQYLLKYHPANNTCDGYDLGQQGRLFALLRDHLVAVQYGDNSIGFYNLVTRQPVDFGPGIPHELPAFIRDLFLDSKGLLWIPTNDGLWQFDLKNRKSRRFGAEDGFADIRFTSIYEDEGGRLFLGTYYGGLHRFDPQSGDITIIDQQQGLSNNAVMSIIPDDEGFLWVGTEYGINIVSPEGEVKNILYEEDGLIYDKLERFDPLKLPDGRLLFGSRQGISIIDPQGVKAAFASKQDVQIFLTELSFFDKHQGHEITLQKNLEKLGTIELPAEYPGIHLHFALSSYLEPHKNRYAYRIEGKDKEWHYLGNQPELNLNRLPPGRYRILIKGADYRNNWTETPLVIPIHAREFFYRQGWFYLLVALPFVVFGLIWARNKQLEARRLELEVARRTKKIEEDKQVIARQAEELKQLDELKTRFFTNISHELRTPVTLIQAPLEDLLQKYGTSLEQWLVKRLQLVLRNTLKLSGLVEELLELSRLEAKKATLNEKPIPLAGFCRQLFSAYSSAADMKQIVYTFHADLAEEEDFRVDPGKLEKILNNLLANALKFTPSNGKVDLRLFQSDSELVMEVRDNGPGIAAEDLPYVFDRFYQAKKNVGSSQSGSGIGLALSRELAVLMQGTLTVESKKGEGALFRLCLPKKPVNADLTFDGEGVLQPEQFILPAVSRIASPKVIDNVWPEKRKLLIVEDNEDMQQLLYSLLGDQYDCQVASNGAVAWQWLESGDPSVQGVELILSDVMMPEMDGYELLEKVKAHQEWQQLPVIMLTARAAEEDKLQALRMGVDDYLLKPFSPAELEARVRNLLHNYYKRRSFRKIEQEQDVEFVLETEASADQIWLKQVEEAARDALARQIKLNASYLANKMFLSERQFSRRLKSATGLSPSEYLQEVKLQRARYLLECKAYLTVNEVAAACGYSSGSYLTKVFQERFGRLPSDYLY